ncbi:MAG: TonB-dependent receptor, partial [Candidatus Krumholzibacteriia bacterium]
WFFGSFMPVYYTNTRTVNHRTGATEDYITKDYKRTETYWNYSFKLTGQLAPNLRVSAGLVSNTSKYKGNLATSADAAEPTVSPDDYGSTYPNYSANLTLDWNVGSLQVNLRGGYFMTNETDPLVKPSEPYWRFANEAGYAATSNAQLDIPDEWKRTTGWRSASAYPYMLQKAKNEKMSVNLDLSYYLTLAGDHALKAGVQFVRQGQNYDNTAAYPIVWLSWDRDCIVAGNNYGRGTYGYYAVRGNDDAGPFGDYYKAYANRWALYLQDSWTIGERFTVNFGVRAESEYIPSYSALEEFSDVKAIEWGFGDKLAPRVGFIWDIKGDASTKVFGSFGIFYDVMKLSMAAGSYGGFMWSSAYYPLNTYEFTQIGQEGFNYGTPFVVQNYRIPSFDSTDPDMKAMSQRELSLGFEQRVTSDIALKVRVVNKKLLWAIEDIGVQTPEGEHYYTTNPGSDFLKESWIIAKEAGVLDPRTPDIPKAKRDYWGVNLSLEKRFSNNWMGGFAYTWSRQTGNYSGLSSGDEDGRTDTNVQRMFDLWYLAYDKNINEIDGPLNVDRTHVFKAYGSYMFPFGLTAGLTLNGMTGVPISTFWDIGAEGYMPFNRGTEGRTDFLALVDLNLSYDLKLGRNTLQLNVNVENLLNTRTAMSVHQYYNQGEIAVTDEELLTGNWDISTKDPVLDPRYKKDRWLYGDGLRGTPLRVTLGFKFSF